MARRSALFVALVACIVVLHGYRWLEATRQFQANEPLTPDELPATSSNTDATSHQGPLGQTKLLAFSSPRDVRSMEVVELHGQPKAGTTWLEVIVHAIATVSGGAVNKTSRLAFIHPRTMVVQSLKHRLPGNPKLIPVQAKKGFLVVRGCVSRNVAIWSPGCISPDLLDRTALGRHRFMLILRDPRAVALSSAHYGGRAVSHESLVESIPEIAGVCSLRYYWHEVLRERPI